ncbi:MAG: hypothetical protein LW807_06880 [Proteobacteria bacterium]|nr:hypothetical protein [Pseudomonadota bacterium]
MAFGIWHLASIMQESISKILNSNETDIRKRKIVLTRAIPIYVKDILSFENFENSEKARFYRRNIKRSLAQLSHMERFMLIIRLLTYIYIIPLLRISIIAFVLIFNLYNFVYLGFISCSRTVKNNNPNINTHIPIFKPITFTHRKASAHPLISWPASADSNYKNKNMNMNTTMHTNTTSEILQLVVNIEQNKTVLEDARLQYSKVAISSYKLDGKQNVRYSDNQKIHLSSRRTQIVFDYNANLKTLLKPPNIVENKLLQSLLVEPLVKKTEKVKISKKNCKQHKSEVKHKPKPKQKPNPQQKQIQRSQEELQNKILQKFKDKTIYDDDLNGYVLIDRRIVVLIEDDKPHVYKVSQQFIDRLIKNKK